MYRTIVAAVLSLAAIVFAAGPGGPPDAPVDDAPCVCPGGLHIVIVQTGTPRASWQERESADALSAIEAWAAARRVDLRVAVVEYDGRAAWSRRGLDAGAGGAYPLLAASTTYVVRGQVRDAAILATRALDAGRRVGEPAPCELVVLMTYSKSHYLDQRQQMLEAAAMLASEATLLVGCPINPGDWYCRIAPSLVLLPERYTEFDEAGILRRGAEAWLAELETGSAPCATPTPEPSESPVPSATPEPTKTPPPPHWRVYLPLLSRSEPCVPRAFYVDVVLVLDASTSMLRSTGNGQRKLDAAIGAAQEFIHMMQSGDRVAVVGFNDTAWVGSVLEAGRAETYAALGALPGLVAEGTRLDLALDSAASAFDPAGRNRPVVILLTDGLPNRVPWSDPCQDQACAVLARAVALKSSGARLITVGLGPDVLDSLLTAAATGAGDYYHAPDAAALDGIYRQIAGGLTGCSTK